MEIKSNLHGKPEEVSARLNFTDTESDPPDRGETDYLKKHPNFDDGMASFDKTTARFLQRFHSHRNILKFVLDCI